jgi:hypothetical protein
MSAKSPIDFLKFARDLRIGDVIETGQGAGYPGDLIEEPLDLDDGTFVLRWGVGPRDCKRVSAWTGIVYLGRMSVVINV